MNFEPALDQALRSENQLGALRSLAQRLVAQEQDVSTVVELFESARLRLQAEGRDADEDVVLEVLDLLTGWCSPHMRIGPEERNPPPGEEPGRDRAGP